MPDLTHDVPNQTLLPSITRYLCELFQAWINDDNPNIEIRIFDRIIKKITTGINIASEANQIICFSTNGLAIPYDVLRNTNFWNMEHEPSINDHSLLQILNSPLFSYMRSVTLSIENCSWWKVAGEVILLIAIVVLVNLTILPFFVHPLEIFIRKLYYLISNSISLDIIKRTLSLLG